MVDAVYYRFNIAVRLQVAYPDIRGFLPPKYSPVNFTGEPPVVKANQGYLYESNEDIVKVIFKLANDYFYFSKVSRLSEPEPVVTTKQGVITSRVGQGAYRQEILRRWNFECAVLKSKIKEILIASHIVPWRDSTDKERLDVDNGLLLSPTYDALFDRNLISFDETGKIILSRSMDIDEYRKLGVTGKEKIDNLTEGNRKYLMRHRQKLISI
jgi:predicted restriction endonuclease